jgi:hypothetical protein
MPSSRRIPAAWLLIGAGAGALAMFLLDPQQGRRRQALLRDQAVHWQRCAGALIGVGLRDLQHRTQGMAARARALVRRGPVDDAVLVERIRAALGRVVSHPHAIEVSAREGRVRIQGPVLEREHDLLLRTVRAVDGVRQLVSRVAPHASADVPALQGGSRRSVESARRWAPGPRLLAMAGGGALVAAGLGLAARSLVAARPR